MHIKTYKISLLVNIWIEASKQRNVHFELEEDKKSQFLRGSIVVNVLATVNSFQHSVTITVTPNF